jgi:hypothetical protein
MDALFTVENVLSEFHPVQDRRLRIGHIYDALTQEKSKHFLRIPIIDVRIGIEPAMQRILPVFPASRDQPYGAVPRPRLIHYAKVNKRRSDNKNRHPETQPTTKHAITFCAAPTTGESKDKIPTILAKFSLPACALNTTSR